MNTLTNAEAIITAVQVAPGHTAHWYSKHFGTPVRHWWVYDAFARTVAAGLILKRPHGKRTVYFPVGTIFCDSCVCDSVYVPATTKSTNPEWSGYDLCEECAGDYNNLGTLESLDRRPKP